VLGYVVMKHKVYLACPAGNYFVVGDPLSVGSDVPVHALLSEIRQAPESKGWLGDWVLDKREYKTPFAPFPPRILIGELPTSTTVGELGHLILPKEFRNESWRLRHHPKPQSQSEFEHRITHSRLNHWRTDHYLYLRRNNADGRARTSAWLHLMH
jgi:hypothetical protein